MPYSSARSAIACLILCLTQSGMAGATPPTLSPADLALPAQTNVPKTEPRFADRCFEEGGPGTSEVGVRVSEAARPLAQAGPELQAQARFTGRLSTCFTTPDGLPRDVIRGDIGFRYQSTEQADCTALLLPGNRVLALGPCLLDDAMEKARIAPARMRLELGPHDKKEGARHIEVNPMPLAEDRDIGAAVFQLTGDAIAAAGGSFPLARTAPPEPGHPVILLFHDAGGAARVLEGCKVMPPDGGKPRRDEILHDCTGRLPPQGGLLLDTGTLDVLGLQVAWTPDGKSIARGIARIMDALDLAPAAAGD